MIYYINNYLSCEIIAINTSSFLFLIAISKKLKPSLLKVKEAWESNKNCTIFVWLLSAAKYKAEF